MKRIYPTILATKWEQTEPKEDPSKQSLQNVIEAAKKSNLPFITKTKTDIPEDQILKTIGLVREQCNLSTNEKSFVAIAILLQKGGCNANKNTQITIQLEDRTIDSKTINKIIRETCKGYTPRAFARQLGKDIFEIAKAYKIPGNISLKLQRNFPELWERITHEDKQYWASDFQTNTPGIPADIANLIQTNYEKGFVKSQSK